MTVQQTVPIHEFAYRDVGPSLIRGRACSYDFQAIHNSHPFATRRNAFYFQTMISSTTHHSYTARTTFGKERPKPSGGGDPSPAISWW